MEDRFAAWPPGTVPILDYSTRAPCERSAGSLKSSLEEAEHLLCAERGCENWHDYLQQAQQGGAGAPCTFVWTSGTLAYRCRTCGITPSSAVCVNCFKASNHEGHDYQMYISDAGGCCDCGDLISWREAGCCPQHRPGQHGVAAALAPREAELARRVLRWALRRAWLAADDAVAHRLPPQRASCRALDPVYQQQLQRREAEAASCWQEQGPARRAGTKEEAARFAAPLCLLRWLSQAAAVPALREILCEEILAHLPPPEAPERGGPPTPMEAARSAMQEGEGGRRAAHEGTCATSAASAGEGGPPGAWYEAEAQRLLDEVARSMRSIIPGEVQAHCSSLISVWLASLAVSEPAWEHKMVQEAATFMILLLYSPGFKYSFGEALVPFYAALATKHKGDPVSQAMDRLTVQVFNSEEATLRLVEHAALLDSMLGELCDLLGLCVDPATGVVAGDRGELRDRRYLRMGADLHLVLGHPSVALHVLSQARLAPQHAQQDDNLGAILRCFAMVQGASPYRRQLGQHVLYERGTWVDVVQLEVHLAHFLKAGLLHPLLELHPADPRLLGGFRDLEHAFGRVLARAASACAAWESAAWESAGEDAAKIEAAASRDGRGMVDIQMLCVWPLLMSGVEGSQVSAHLPLNRLAASFLAALVHLASRPGAPPGLSESSEILKGRGVLAEASPAVAQGGWEETPLPLCALGALRVLAWMSQIRHGLWVRNGDEVLRLEYFYNSQYWYEHAADMDLLIIQAWAATSAHPDRVVRGVLEAFGGHPICMAAAAFEDGTDERMAAGVMESTVARMAGAVQELQCFTDGLRLLVTLLRERWAWLPASDERLMRRTLVHVLAQGPRSHSSLMEELTYKMGQNPKLDEVLADVALYSRRSEQQAGLYRLRNEAWSEFDPFHFHYSRRELQAALQEAHSRRVWRPRQQLAPPLSHLPFFLAGVGRVLEEPFLYWVVWVVLRYCTAHCPDGSADDASLAALNLLSLALDHLSSGAAPAAAAAAAAVSGTDSLGITSSVSGRDSMVSEAQQEVKPLPAGIAELLERGSGGCVPGVVEMLREIAGAGAPQSGGGSEPPGTAGEGRKREYGWELSDCALHLVEVVEGILRHQRQDQGAGTTVPVTATTGSPMEAEEVAQQAKQGAVTAHAEVPQKADVEAAQRRERARLKREKMQARMKAQQAQFISRQSPSAIRTSPSVSELESEEGPASREGLPPLATPSPDAAMESPGSVSPVPSAMDIDSGVGDDSSGRRKSCFGEGEGGELAAEAAQQLPPHHPSSWERVEGECALCHAGQEAGPLGWVAHVQTSPLAMLAAASQRNTSCVGALDASPMLHVLCCGHMLHQECLGRYSESLRRRLAAGQDFDGRLLLDRSGDSELLCPICRRIGNTLLPVTQTPKRAGSANPPAEGPLIAGSSAPSIPRRDLQHAQQADLQEQSQQQQILLDPQVLLAELECLVGPGSENWVAISSVYAFDPLAGTATLATATLGRHHAMVAGFEKTAKRVAATAEIKQKVAAVWLASRQRQRRQQQKAEAGAGAAELTIASRPLWGIDMETLAEQQLQDTIAVQRPAAALPVGHEHSVEGREAEEGEGTALGELLQQEPDPEAPLLPIAMQGGEDWGLEEGEGEGEGNERDEDWEEAMAEWGLMAGDVAMPEGGGEDMAGQQQQQTQQTGAGPPVPPVQPAGDAGLTTTTGAAAAPPPVPPPAGQTAAAAAAQHAQQVVAALVRDFAGPLGQMEQAVTAELLGTLVRNAVEDLLEGGLNQAVAVAVAAEAARGAVEGGSETQPQAPLALVAGAMIQAMQMAVARLNEDPHLPGGLLARALARELVRMGVAARAAAEAGGRETVAGDEEGVEEEEGEGEEGLVGDLQALEEEMEVQRGWAGQVGSTALQAGPAGVGGAGRLASVPLYCMLWSMLAQNIAQWEVAERGGLNGAAGAAGGLVPPPAVVQAHWRSMQSMAHLALACSTESTSGSAQGAGADIRADIRAHAGSEPADEAMAALQWLWSDRVSGGGSSSTAEPPQLQSLPCCSEFLISRLGRVPDALSWPPQDLFLATVKLLAGLLTPRREATHGGRGQWVVHRHPAAVLKVLLQLLYPLAVAKAVQGVPGAEQAAQHGQLDEELEGALSCQLLPWLVRSRTLMALVSSLDAPSIPPAGPPVQPSTAAALSAARHVQGMLGLPSLISTLRGPATIMAQLALHTAAAATKGSGQQAQLLPPSVPEPPLLLSLTQPYQEWYLALARRRCSVCREVPKELALCLLCEEVMCCSSRKCTGPVSWGMCYTHAMCCGGGTGVFFLPKNTRVLVLRKGRATFAPSPYLDAHGEEDRYMKRGKPLYLSNARYNQLQELWLGSAFDFDSTLLHAANRGSSYAHTF